MEIRPPSRYADRRRSMPPTTFMATTSGGIPITGRCNGISDEKLNIQAKMQSPKPYTAQQQPCQVPQKNNGGGSGVYTPTPMTSIASASKVGGGQSAAASRRGSHTSLIRGEAAALARKASATSKVGTPAPAVQMGATEGQQAAGDAQIGQKSVHASKACSRSSSKTSIASSKRGAGEELPNQQLQQGQQVQPGYQQQYYQRQGQQYYQQSGQNTQPHEQAAQQGQYNTQQAAQQLNQQQVAQYSQQQQAQYNQQQGAQYNQQQAAQYSQQQAQYNQQQAQYEQQQAAQYTQQQQAQYNQQQALYEQQQAAQYNQQQATQYSQQQNPGYRQGQQEQYYQQDGQYSQQQGQQLSPRQQYQQGQYNTQQGQYTQQQAQYGQQAVYNQQEQYNPQQGQYVQSQGYQQQQNANRVPLAEIPQHQQNAPQANVNQVSTPQTGKQTQESTPKEDTPKCGPQAAHLVTSKENPLSSQCMATPIETVPQPQSVTKCPGPTPQVLSPRKETPQAASLPVSGAVVTQKSEQVKQPQQDNVQTSGGDTERLRGGGTTVPGTCPPCPCICPPPCGTCCSVAVTTGNQKLCKYIQPPVVKSYKPNLQYCPPQMKMDDGTIYRKSYMPVHVERDKPFHQEGSICLGIGKISSDTINRMSYKNYNNFKPPCPILPCEHNLLGDGPMQEMTTNRHDYVPKPYSKPCSFESKQNLYLSDCPLSNDTTFRMSYKPNPITERVVPIKPVPALEGPCGKMSGDTIHKMSYQPWQQPEPMDMPWKDKKPYSKPCLPMSNDTIYRKSYFPNCGDSRRDPIRPDHSRNPFGNGCEFSDKTVYRMSYIPSEANTRPVAVHPVHNLQLGCGPFEKNTINRMSYQGHKVLPPCPILPCEHNLLGEGPMQEMTTQRHDYVPKPFSKVEAFHPQQSIFNSDCPLSDKTIQRMSYQPVCSYEKAKPIRPVQALERVTGPFEDRTVQKMSYQPWQPVQREDMPWADKKKYVPPKLRMEGNTIYRMSFDAPGEYVDCPQGDPTCVPCPPPPCKPTPPCVPCQPCNPCCCPYPTAAC